MPIPILHWCRSIFIVMNVLRAPLALLFLASIALYLPDQTKEIYRAIAQDFDIKRTAGVTISEFLTSLFGLLGIGATLYYVSACLLRGAPRDYVHSSLIRLIPPALSGMFFVVIASGIYFAQTPELDPTVIQSASGPVKHFLGLDKPTGPEDDPIIGATVRRLLDHNLTLWRGAFIVIYAGLSLTILLVAVQSFRDTGGHQDRSLFGARGQLIFASVAVGFLALCISSVWLPRLVGPLAIVALFFIALLFVAAWLSHVGDVHGIPFITMLLLFAFSLSVLDINDNHSIRTIGAWKNALAGDERDNMAPTLEEQFLKWFDARPDKAIYFDKGRPYPVYVVAAQGGGMYAAFDTAAFLASILDNCESFRHHFFALSGVSGGSIGAAVYASVVAGSAQTSSHVDTIIGCGPRADKAVQPSAVDVVDDILSDDYISPVFSGFLFGDFLQRFLPVPIPVLDRARNLEYALEESVDRAAHKFAGVRNLMKQPFANHWRPEDSSPALLLNTTEVATGRRMVIAPWTFATDELRFLPLRISGRQIPLSVAAGLSARFPWLAPAGWFTEPTNRGAPEKVHLVDGTYFENSGVATALDLIRALKELARKHNIGGRLAINLIILTRGGYPSSSSGLGDFTAPVQALLNTRTGRAYYTIAQAERELGSDDVDLGATPRIKMHKVHFSDPGFSPPLGWRLSTSTLLLLRAQSEATSDCTSSGMKEKEGVPESAMLDAGCIKRAIQADLTVAP
jgi:hypothetical protein